MIMSNEIDRTDTTVEGQEAVGAKESDAVSEEEGSDAVRLLTIHAAKGLEFEVVVVADAGRSRPPVSDILALSDGRFGFKVAHPATGSRVSTTSYQDVKAHREHAEQAERLRLYYVAMTRAKERLIVSGSVGEAADARRQTPQITAAVRRTTAPLSPSSSHVLNVNGLMRPPCVPARSAPPADATRRL